jgi:hypothetical protein
MAALIFSGVIAYAAQLVLVGFLFSCDMEEERHRVFKTKKSFLIALIPFSWVSKAIAPIITHWKSLK